jgi:dolichyl-phosphate beta-glucosyltransferase
MTASRTIVVVPCYNEEERLDAGAFESFARARPDVTFLFVDDGSRDGTHDLLQRIVQRHPGHFALLALDQNRGKAEAVRQGLLDACRRGAKYAGFWDADLATPLDELPGFVALLDEKPHLEMVFGSRVKLLGRFIHRKTARHYFGRGFATLAALALGLPLYDTQCGAKLFRVSPRFEGLLQDRFIGGWIFDCEIVARAIRSRRGTSLPPVRDVIYEHPLTAWRDVDGSKVSALDIPFVACSLARIYWRYLR